MMQINARLKVHPIIMNVIFLQVHRGTLFNFDH